MGRQTLTFQSTGKHYTWDSAKKAAVSQGGDLPTLKDIKKFIKKNGGFALYPGADLWVPVYGKSGKDWVQAGDKHHKPGKSHVEEQGGYPDWGDQGGDYAFNTMLVVVKPNFHFYKGNTHYTWTAAHKAAKSRGEDLPYLSKMKKIFKKRGAFYPGEDVWAPCYDDNGKKDWVQIGDKHHKPGKSHSHEQGGYPDWGDQGGDYAFNTILVTYDHNIHHERTKTHYTWDSAAKAALKKGGRLCTTKELKKWLKVKGSLYPGEDVWAACLSDKGKDWIQIGDKHHKPGKSHVLEQGGYPDWGDDGGDYAFNTVLVWN